MNMNPSGVDWAYSSAAATAAANWPDVLDVRNVSPYLQLPTACDFSMYLFRF